jgi:hypothetical protein
MSQPSTENIEVSLHALREEGDYWQRVSDALAPIAPFVTTTQDLNAVQMGIFAPAHSAYHEVCVVVGRVAQTGTDETKRIADMLANIAAVYEHEEEVNVGAAQSIHQQQGKW